jgi:hypothetical protein
MTEKPTDPGPKGRPIRHGVGSSAEVRFADFRAATQDPEVKKFLADAKAQGEKMERKGLIHP